MIFQEPANGGADPLVLQHLENGVSVDGLALLGDGVFTCRSTLAIAGLAAGWCRRRRVRFIACFSIRFCAFRVCLARFLGLGRLTGFLGFSALRRLAGLLSLSAFSGLAGFLRFSTLWRLAGFLSLSAFSGLTGLLSFSGLAGFRRLTGFRR
ncbi:MAG: hypothetical protein CVV27_09760 [Candidatus Melainabacteria bacterium HGW-Melainabacteria-1]|nr:MAG: hypothetical protein CVV27_09760 [Candidatus Melainabacteria bacterium HGW-Melainabacteria-1]